MAWDETNERLAVSFAACADRCPLVAIFRTHLRYASAHPEIIPSGFIRGQPGRFPQRIEFIKRSCFAVGHTLASAYAAYSLVTTLLPRYFPSGTRQRSDFVFT